jgi:site-specific recombinase XerD
MLDLIKLYINHNRNNWSEACLTAESSRLAVVAGHLDNTPEDLYEYLNNNYAPYTVQTIWTRVTSFYDFLLSQQLINSSSNPYKTFREMNRNLFKNLYVRKELNLTFEDALSKIESMTNKDARDHAKRLLFSGMRFTESLTLKDGWIVGKGDKRRKVFLPEDLYGVYPSSYRTFSRHLKKVGLSAHMLRKLAATKFVEVGYKEAELLNIMGWSSITTAQYYLQPKDDMFMHDTAEELYARYV